MAGVTPAGLIPATVTEIVTNLTADLRGPQGIDPAIDVSPDQPLGQIVGASARQLATAWELAQTLANVLNPNAAEGVLLDNLCAITGTLRQGPAYSYVTCTVNLNAAVTLPAGSVANVAGQVGNRWVLVGPPDAYGAPPAAPTNVVSTAAGNYPSVWRGEQYGAQLANAGTLTNPVSAVTGWNSVTNPLDAQAGQLTESDPALRRRRRAELSLAGGSTTDSMRAKLLQTPGMLQAYVLENTTMVTDANGLLAKSTEAVIYDGVTPLASNATIAAAIWKNKGSGAALGGATTVNTTDSAGVTRPVRFTRATSTLVDVRIDVTTDTAVFPSDGVAQIKAALVAKGTSIARVGGAIYPLTLQAYVLGLVPGIANITLFKLLGDVLAIQAGTREIFRFDTSVITVNVT